MPSAKNPAHKQIAHSFNGVDITPELTPDFLLGMAGWAKQADFLRQPRLGEAIEKANQAFRNLTPREQAIAAVSADLLFEIMEVPKARQAAKRRRKGVKSGSKSHWTCVDKIVNKWVTMRIDGVVSSKEAVREINKDPAVREIREFPLATFEGRVKRRRKLI